MSSLRCLLILSALVLLTKSLYQKLITFSERPFRATLAMMAKESNSNNGGNRINRFKVISPNDIASLFSDSTHRGEKPSSSSVEEEDYDDSDDSDDEDREAAELPQSLALEIVEMQALQMTQQIDMDGSKGAVPFSSTRNLSRASTSNPLANVATPTTSQDEHDYTFADVNKELVLSDAELYDQLIATMTMIDTTAVSSPDVKDVRVFRYDPRDETVFEIDKMKYGAYRRTLEPSPWSREAAKQRKEQESMGRSIRRRGGGGNKDRFYDDVKRLGIEEDLDLLAEGGGSGTVDFAEPEEDLEPVVLRKPVIQKQKSRISPRDIDNLFKTNTQSAAKDITDDKNYSNIGDDSQTDNMFDNAGDSLKQIMSAFQSSTVNNESQSWLEEAEKEIQLSRSGMSSRRRSVTSKTAITNDWRFWAAIITGAGFVVAFYNVYQQTGGFVGTGQGPELIL